jgi:glutamate synthase domain-containing protein 3
MDGPFITVSDNAQDGVGNTMNSGKVVVNGAAGDVLGYGMRGGRIYIAGDAGYRVGIHMKSFESQVPVIIIGGCARDFLGEYMAGGVIIVLGLSANGMSKLGNFIGTGMHGGTIYIRGEIEPSQLGKEVAIKPVSKDDINILEGYLADYCREINIKMEEVMNEQFVKLYPYSTRPYGKIYAY